MIRLLRFWFLSGTLELFVYLFCYFSLLAHDFLYFGLQRDLEYFFLLCDTKHFFVSD